MLQPCYRRLIVQHQRRDVNCSFCHHPLKRNHSLPSQSTPASLFLSNWRFSTFIHPSSLIRHVYRSPETNAQVLRPIFHLCVYQQCNIPSGSPPAPSSRGVHSAFHARFWRPYTPDSSFSRSPPAPAPSDSLTVILSMKSSRFFETGVSVANPSISFAVKGTVTTRNPGFLPRTSTVRTSLPNIIAPRMARILVGDDDRTMDTCAHLTPRVTYTTCTRFPATRPWLYLTGLHQSPRATSLYTRFWVKSYYICPPSITLLSRPTFVLSLHPHSDAPRIKSIRHCNIAR
jgi:hypothetical protein